MKDSFKKKFNVKELASLNLLRVSIQFFNYRLIAFVRNKFQAETIIRCLKKRGGKKEEILHVSNPEVSKDGRNARDTYQSE